MPPIDLPEITSIIPDILAFPGPSLTKCCLSVFPFARPFYCAALLCGNPKGGIPSWPIPPRFSRDPFAVSARALSGASHPS